nr:hypothetical protein [Roseburia sp. OM04-10AA]
MSSRMEQIIEEIEEYIDNCKYQPLSSTKIVVNKDELEELLTELKMKRQKKSSVIRRLSATKKLFWQMPRQKQMPSLLRHRYRPASLSVNTRLCNRLMPRQMRLL